MRLTHERRGSARPIGIVKLQPERDVEGETHRGPQPSTKEHCWTRNPDCICQGCARSRQGAPRPDPGRLIEGGRHWKLSLMCLLGARPPIKLEKDGGTDPLTGNA